MAAADALSDFRHAGGADVDDAASDMTAESQWLMVEAPEPDGEDARAPAPAPADEAEAQAEDEEDSASLSSSAELVAAEECWDLVILGSDGEEQPHDPDEDEAVIAVDDVLISQQTEDKVLAAAAAATAAQDAEAESEAPLEAVSETVVEVPATLAKVCSREPRAVLLGFAPLDLSCAGGALSELGEFRGDTTAQWLAALAAFPAITGAVCLGRVAVETSGADSGGLDLGAVARVVVQNIGHAAWPETTALRLVAGHGLGFGALQVGALEAGHAAELVLDLSVPRRPVDGYSGARSGWVLEDGCGAPFGPLLQVEVTWA